MVRLIGLWTLLLAMSSSFAAQLPFISQYRLTYLGELQKPVSEVLKKKTPIRSNVMAKIDEISFHETLHFMKAFSLGELNILPYTSPSQNKPSQSQAYFTFKLPDVCLGVQVRTGLCYQLEKNQKNGIGSQEQVLYLISTKTLNENKWRPFVSVSYLRSQVRGTPKLFFQSLEEMILRSTHNYQGSDRREKQIHYSNVEVIETSCGLQPHERLCLVLSYNYLKPLSKKGIQWDAPTAKVFNEMKIKSQSQGLDLKVDYTLKEGMNLLLKSEYLLSHRHLKDKADKPVVIEGSLIVSF